MRLCADSVFHNSPLPRSPFRHHAYQLLYNDSSPMENHHIAASYAVLRESQNNFMEHIPRQVDGGHHATHMGMHSHA